MIEPFLRISDRIACLPVIHGSGDFALEVRRLMLEERFDCVAVPIPNSFRKGVEAAVGRLPAITLVTQAEPAAAGMFGNNDDDDDDEPDSDDDEQPTLSFVPIDPCQPVIAAVRSAMEQRIPRAFIDLEVERFVPYAGLFPDPYALKKVSPARFAAALLPAIPPPVEGQPQQRIAAMAARLRTLEGKHRSILFVCSMLDWVWVRDAYQRDLPAPEDESVEPTETYRPNDKTLIFMLGELPFITALYERAGPTWRTTRTSRWTA